MGKKDVVLLKRIPIVRKIVGTIIKEEGGERYEEERKWKLYY